MGFIKEIDHPLGQLYGRYTNEGELIQTVGIVGFQKEYNNFRFFILTDIHGNLLKDPNRYLNFMLSKSNFKKRENAFTALKLLYSFFELFHIKNVDKGLSQQDFKKLMRFLTGGNDPSNAIQLDFSYRRKNQTINNYLSVYRQYYSHYFQINDSILHDKITIAHFSGGGLLGHANKQKQEAYKSSLGSITKEDKPPMYISMNEYEEIINLIDEKHTLRDKIIVKLMYEYGLRIGEVLGLTFEDVDSEDDLLILRNRLSDKPFQSAKGVMKITSREEYKLDAYWTNRIGYQEIILEDDVKELIEEYIDETRDEFFLNRSAIKRKNLEVYSVADKVSDRQDIYVNQYIFLNSQNYTPLTQVGWNDKLRKIFADVGIEMDKKKREHNLNHRFRHGFAMKKVQEGYTAEALADALRHSDTSTVMRYFKPDTKYRIKMMEKTRSIQKGGNHDDD